MLYFITDNIWCLSGISRIEILDHNLELIGKIIIPRNLCNCNNAAEIFFDVGIIFLFFLVKKAME